MRNVFIFLIHFFLNFKAKEDSLSKAESKIIALELDNKVLQKEKHEADNEIARLKAECEKVSECRPQVLQRLSEFVQKAIHSHKALQPCNTKLEISLGYISSTARKFPLPLTHGTMFVLLLLPTSLVNSGTTLIGGGGGEGVSRRSLKTIKVSLCQCALLEKCLN